MKKLLSAVFILVLLVSMASADSHKVGFISKLNMNQEEYQILLDGMAKFGEMKFFSLVNREPAQLVFYDSLMSMQMALNSGEIDEMALPEAVAEYVMNVNDAYTISCIMRTPTASLSFGFRAKDEESAKLKDKFNDALLSMKADGALSILKAKYIFEPGIDDPEPVVFENYNGADTIKVAVTGDLPPIDFVGADGKPAGFNTAVLSEIGRRLHLNIELVDIDSGARAAALASKRADVVFWIQTFKGLDTQADVPEGIILSESYFEWNNYFHIAKK